ncbi:DegT/DnrJ/EryC1/StrS family aminotransferase [Azospirillum sp. Marseille-Q6669]
MSALAILGGTPVLREPLPARRSIGRAEVEAVARVAESGCLSGFYGSWGDEFLGGPLVRQFEEGWRRRFGARHAVSVNSATSGLFAAMGAIGVSPGDEVIVPPYTMSATAMAPLVYGAIPRFVDIEEETFALDPAAVERAITPRTRAILVTNLFGHPAKLGALRALADRHGLFLVEDNAQGPLASEAGRLAGTVGHIGVFSLNYHKHIHTGEGGMCVTDDDDLALRLQMIRNHGENAVEAVGMEMPVNMVGFNYRLTELGAAVGITQLARIDELVGSRERIGQRLSAGLQGLEGLTPPTVRPGCRHVYYVWALRVDPAQLGATRTQFAKALAAEGFPNFEGYVRPLYLLPAFQKRIALGRDGFPFTLSDVRYEPGLCPVAERMHAESLVGFEPCAHDLDDGQIDALIAAICKVHAHRHDLRRIG